MEEQKEFKNIIEQKMQDIGLKPDFSLIQNSFVSIPTDTKDKMFEEFLKILSFFNSDENAFKLGRIDKEHRFACTCLATFANKQDICKKAQDLKIKPRYPLIAEWFKNWNIACTATESKTGNKSDQFKEIASSFINFKSLLTYQEARHMQPEEAEGATPTEKLKRGILGR